MKKIILYKYYNILLQGIYNNSLKIYGFTPEGVYWNNKDSQYKRFSILTFLLRKFSSNKHLKIADVGCGYAELLNFFLLKNKEFKYEGYDINNKMIAHCKKKFENVNFYSESYPINQCDVSVMSGTYNYAVTDNIESWESYIIDNLKNCYKKCNLGIIFNLQFKKKRIIRNYIYYTEIDFMYRLLQKNFKKINKFYSLESKRDIHFVIYKN